MFQKKIAELSNMLVSRGVSANINLKIFDIDSIRFKFYR